MSDRALARFGMVMCLPPMIATWQMGDIFATVTFAFGCGFFFREQL